MSDAKTIGQFARETGIPDWKVRKAADSLSEDVPRAGGYRILTSKVQKKLRKHFGLEVAAQ